MAGAGAFNVPALRRRFGPLSTYIHTYIHTYIRTYIHTYIHTYTNAYIHVQLNAGIHRQAGILSVFYLVAAKDVPVKHSGEQAAAIDRLLQRR